MRQKTILDVVVLLLLVPIVIVCFRVLPNRQIAALIAGTLFLFGPLFLALQMTRVKMHRGPRTLGVGSLAQFILFFAVPIFFTRLLNWGTPFDQLNILGFPAAEWHIFSNRSYILMFLGLIASDLLEIRQQSKQKTRSY